jgi:hypothetical protein
LIERFLILHLAAKAAVQNMHLQLMHAAHLGGRNICVLHS